MGRSCFVCIIRPLVYFTYFSYGFAKLKCPHWGNAADKAVILRDPTRWCISLAIHLFLTVMMALTLYLTVTPRKFDYFTIFTTLELISAQIGLIRLISENAGWKQRLQQLQLMLSIWNYVGTFRAKRYHYFLSYKFSVSAIFVLPILNVLSTIYFFYGEISYLTFINIFTRFSVGMLITGTYVYTLYEFFYYYLLFKWTFEQIEREVNSRLAMPSKLAVTNANLRFPRESRFVEKLRKLRKLYTVILYSFYRHKKIRSLYIIAVILIYHFLLILIVFLAFIVMRGVVEFNISNFLYLFKYIAYFFYLGSIFMMCDNMQELLQHSLTVLFKVQLNVLSQEEAREVELFTKFLIWEQPSDSSKDLPVYKMNLLMNIVVDIITNTMVVIQLYFWFTKKA